MSNKKTLICVHIDSSGTSANFELMENKKENKNGKMTIDKLARMTQDEFSVMGERFDKVDERLDKMDTTLNKMNITLKTVLDVVLEIPSKKAFGRLEDKVQMIDVRLASVERKVK